ncbi:MAG TPA: sulfatase [Verrucomicrobiae bacterium]|nr:sulfatase [Verrucomicrobiae bacterium]
MKRHLTTIFFEMTIHPITFSTNKPYRRFPNACFGTNAPRSVLLFIACLFIAPFAKGVSATDNKRPNILVAISDDQSFAHTSIAGYPGVKTPNFDRLAREGVLFNNAFAACPSCSPSRAALLTGRQIWQIEQAGTHWSSFPTNYIVYPDLLEQAGYFVGFTGKGWSPGDWKASGRVRNPAGSEYNQRHLKPPFSGISKEDYAANFADFLAARPKGKPFCFWYGAHEPHRGYENGSGLKSGKNLADGPPPSFLPDAPAVRSDLLDYCAEIEWFDTQLGRILKQLQETGELENTLIIVTSDNGMPFGNAKATLYDYGIHEPLVVHWPERVPGGRTVDDLISLVDLAPTILEAAGVPQSTNHPPMIGRSIMNLLRSEKEGLVDSSRTVVYAGRERHSSSRYNNLGYPSRALRTKEFLYIRNFRPDRWPLGDPFILNSKGKPEALPGIGYKDTDTGPTSDYLVANSADPQVEKYFALTFGKRPAEELFDILKDPGCLNNLATDPRHANIRKKLSQQLDDYLHQTEDPRVLNGGAIFETYRRYGPIRQFPRPTDYDANW